MKSQFNRFKMLRALAVEGIRPAGLERRPHERRLKDMFLHVADHLRLPNAVGELIHLRYLSLRSSLFLCLPSSLGNLQNLQTLDLRDAGVIRIPNVLWKMRELRCLYLPDVYGAAMEFMGKYKMKLFCKKLRVKGLDKLEILENFCPSACSSQDTSTLTNLRVLSALVFADEFDGDFRTEVHKLMSNSDHVGCRSLRIDSIKDSAATTTLIKKEAVSDVVDQCFSRRNLQELEISCPMANFPKYEAQYMYAGLLKLRLLGTKIEEDPMETLERLPNLQSLDLGYRSFLGKEMRCKAMGFGQLRSLQLRFLGNLEKWNVDEGAMPNLSILTIRDCPKLEMVPNGLRFIKTLKELIITEMPDQFLDRIQATNGESKGQDFDKVSHVPSIMIRQY